MKISSKIVQRIGMLRTALFLEEVIYKILPSRQRLKFIYFILFSLRLNEMFARSNGIQDYHVYVINLDRDRERMESFQKRCKKMSIAFKRVSGVDCADLDFEIINCKQLLGSKFYGGDLFPRGSFASFLSHRKVWLQFLETTDPVALICEDDTLLLGPLPSVSSGFHFPEGADVIFANNRMGEGFFSKKYYHQTPTNRPRFYGIFEALMNICSEQPYLGGPGLDGYFVTRKGAEKLLALYSELKYTMNNDWFIVFNSLSPDQQDAFRKAAGSERLDSVSLPEGPLLESYVMVPSLVELGDFNTSIRMLDPTMLATREEMLRGESSTTHDQGDKTEKTENPSHNLSS